MRKTPVVAGRGSLSVRSAARERARGWESPGRHRSRSGEREEEEIQVDHSI